MSQNLTGYSCYYNLASVPANVPQGNGIISQGNQGNTNTSKNVYNQNLTRGIYDKCAYNQRLHESTSPLNYVINPVYSETASKCHQPYVGYLGSLGGAGYGVGSDRIDLESDIMGKTRLLSKCPSHSYNPHSYSYCGACPNCSAGMPCNCSHCKTTDINNLQDCNPAILPVESLDSRNWNACSDLNGVFINRFDYLCQNPQDPNRVIFYKNTNRRLGEETRLDIKDKYPYGPRGMMSCNH